MSKFDDFFFNNYELVKKVYVYSHLNSNFIEREKWEFYYKFFIGLVSIILIIPTFFKIFTIVFYFIIIQIIINFFKFTVTLIQTKFLINWKEYLNNLYVYFKQVLSRIYFYNFFKYDKIMLSFFFVFNYILFIMSNLLFVFFKKKDFYFFEKKKLCKLQYYIIFESYLIIEITCYILYSMRNLVHQFILIFFYILFIICIIGVSNYIKIVFFTHMEIIIIIDNIIFCIIFIFLNLNAIINIKIQNKKSKIFIK